MSFAFDGPNRIISIVGQSQFDVADLLSRWADWVVVSDNAKYLPAFRSIGGDDVDVSLGTTVPIFAFLLNGWKIRPQEADHTLTVGGGIVRVEGGGEPFISTLGGFQVKIDQPVSAISVGNPDPWLREGENGESYGDMFRVMHAMITADATGLENGNPAFLSLDKAKVRLQALYTNGTRVITDRDGSK